MAGIEKLITNGIQTTSHAIRKADNVASRTTKEMGAEKLTGTLDNLAANNSILIQKSDQSALKTLSGEGMILYNRIKEVLDANEIQYNPRELVQKIRFYSNSKIRYKGYNLENIAEGKFSDGTYVSCHRYCDTLNQKLRKGQHGGIIQTLVDKGFETVEATNKEMVVYRKVASSSCDEAGYGFMKRLLKLNHGESFIDTGYSYSSFDIDLACACRAIGGNDELSATIVIKVPKGAKVSQMPDVAQAECIFPRNAEFKVIKPYDKETQQIMVEYILPDK